MVSLKGIGDLYREDVSPTLISSEPFRVLPKVSHLVTTVAPLPIRPDEKSVAIVPSPRTVLNLIQVEHDLVKAGKAEAAIT